jgi:hypothetical protein
VAGVVWSAAACAPGPAQAGGTIDREIFIETYVDLRVAALGSETGTLGDDARAEVLARHGVTAEDLLYFADVHGRDVELMRDVWNEVEVRLDALRPESTPSAPDSGR